MVFSPHSLGLSSKDRMLLSVLCILTFISCAGNKGHNFGLAPMSEDFIFCTDLINKINFSDNFM